MSFIKVTTNIPKIRKRLRKYPPKVGRNMATAIRKSAFVIEGHAKRRSPVDTGRLRGSISSDILPIRAVIAPHVNYAIFVHEGTRFMRSRPFMKQATRDARGRIREIFRQEIKKGLR